MLAAMMRRIERTGGRYVVLVALALLAGLAVWLAGAVRAPPARRSSGCHLRLPIPAGRRGLGKPDGIRSIGGLIKRFGCAVPAQEEKRPGHQRAPGKASSSCKIEMAARMGDKV